MEASDRAVILESTRQAREGRHERRDAPFGEHLCRIPFEDFWALCKIFPGLKSKNADEKQAAWAAFHASEYSLPYRVARTPIQVQRAPRR